MLNRAENPANRPQSHADDGPDSGLTPRPGSGRPAWIAPTCKFHEWDPEPLVGGCFPDFGAETLQLACDVGLVGIDDTTGVCTHPKAEQRCCCGGVVDSCDWPHLLNQETEQ